MSARAFIMRPMYSLTDLSPSQLRQAADIRERIESLEHDLSQILTPGSHPQPTAIVAPKRKISQATIARIRAGAKARWARIKGTTVAKPAKQPKRAMSAAAKARLSAIAKARWRKARAAGKHAL